MWTVSLTQYYTATTLDGFIADADNSLDWLFTRNRDPDGPLSYGAFIADVGAMAMGSTTYEWILDHEFAGKDPQEWKWRTRSRAGSSRTGSCGWYPGRRSSSRAWTSRPCRSGWSRLRGAGTSGSSAVETWSVSSPKRGCSTRSSCRSRRS